MISPFLIVTLMISYQFWNRVSFFCAIFVPFCYHCTIFSNLSSVFGWPFPHKIPLPRCRLVPWFAARALFMCASRCSAPRMRSSTAAWWTSNCRRKPSLDRCTWRPIDAKGEERGLRGEAELQATHWNTHTHTHNNTHVYIYIYIYTLGSQTRKKRRVSGKTRGFWQKPEVFQTSTKIRG